jgi:hypothetical protein
VKDSTATAAREAWFEQELREGRLPREQYDLLMSWLEYNGKRLRVWQAHDAAVDDLGEEGARQLIIQLVQQRTDRQEAYREAAAESLFKGLGCGILAGAISLGTYLLARDQGGTYVVFWGAGVFAAIMILRAIFLYVQSRL